MARFVTGRGIDGEGNEPGIIKMSQSDSDVKAIFCEAPELGSNTQLQHYLKEARGEIQDLRDRVDALLRATGRPNLQGQAKP